MTKHRAINVCIAIDLDQMERDAIKRLTYFISRVASQHLRRMRDSWRASK